MLYLNCVIAITEFVQQMNVTFMFAFERLRINNILSDGEHIGEEANVQIANQKKAHRRNLPKNTESNVLERQRGVY
jgi:hypothetical protein